MTPSLAKTKARVRRAAARLTGRDKVPPLEERLAAPKLLRGFADAVPDAFFVEIGSNDGEQHDHLRPFILERNWRGIMVEPVGYIFERLHLNYAHLERVALENVAIAEADGELPFFHLVDATPEERDRLPSWYDGVGSFRKDVVLGHAKDIPDVAERVVETPVETLTFDSLCRRHGADLVDLLVVDTEGYDWEIIKSIDLERWAPSLVLYEHFHLSTDDRSASLEHFHALGYETMEEGFDTFCLGPSAPAEVRALWRTLRPAVRGVSVQDERAQA